MGSAAPLTSTGPRHCTLTPRGRCGAHSAYAASVSCTHPGGQLLSVRAAMFMVLPKRQYRRRIRPTMPEVMDPL